MTSHQQVFLKVDDLSSERRWGVFFFFLRWMVLYLAGVKGLYKVDYLSWGGVGGGGFLKVDELSSGRYF